MVTGSNNPFTTVIFSRDRPMQLDICLTSNEKCCTEKEARNEHVIYKASDEHYEDAYRQVAKEHPTVKFIQETTFKLNLYNCLKGKKYILFVVDDCIFTKKYSLNTIKANLDICEGVLGFSLRLGKNTKFCYPLNIENKIPSMQRLGTNIYAFNWKETGEGDFSYPLEVSSSVYRVADIKPIIEGIHYSNPNQLEWVMYNYVPQLIRKPFFLCYETSVAFSNPINRVQIENNNRVWINPNYTTEKLLVLYNSGYRIDYSLFDNFTSNGCHQEVDINFISPNAD